MSCKNEGSTHYACDCVLDQLRAADRLAEVVREAMVCLRNGLPCCMDNCEGKTDKALADYEKAKGK